MKKLLRLLTIISAASPLALTGCGLDQYPAYSPSVKYGIRTDPVLRVAQAALLGDERFDADRPGVFPLSKLDDIFQSDHPYNAKLRATTLASTLATVMKEKGSDPEKMSEADKAKAQDRILADPQQREKLRAALDPIFRDTAMIADKERKELEDALTKAFGTPANPTVKAEGISQTAIDTLKLDDKTLAEGSKRYRIHCLHCHGVSGDGRGPTARWINPHPRDFRANKFKFTSVVQIGALRPPSRADLLRTLRAGIEGTAMPTFNLLADDELESLVSYVIHLSVRGDVEQAIIKEMILDQKTNRFGWDAEAELDIDQTVQSKTKRAVTHPEIGWISSQDPANWIKVEPYPYKDGDFAALKASVKRGKEIFNAKPSDELLKEYITRMPADVRKRAETEAADKKLSGKEATDYVTKVLTEKATSTLKAPNCVNCHTNYGREAKFRFDDWGTLTRPNNFTLGVFRGGRRPVDIYYRIHSGIPPAGMTSFGNVLQGQDIWDLVNFVSTVSLPGMRQKLEMGID